jgi:hypothetical protein
MVWAGGALGRPAAKINYLTTTAKESVTARLARRQERLRGRKSVQDEKLAEKLWDRVHASGDGASVQPAQPEDDNAAPKPGKKMRRKKSTA